jgi:hypothetical protein
MATTRKQEINALYAATNNLYNRNKELFDIIEKCYSLVVTVKEELNEAEEELADPSTTPRNRVEIEKLIPELKEELKIKEKKARRIVYAETGKSVNELCLQLEPDAKELSDKAHKLHHIAYGGGEIVDRYLKKYVSIYPKIEHLLEWGINSPKPIMKANPNVQPVNIAPIIQPVNTNKPKSWFNRARNSVKGVFSRKTTKPIAPTGGNRTRKWLSRKTKKNNNKRRK